MDVIKMAKDLGHALQEMDSYKEMMRLSNECDNNKELQEKVEKFNELKGLINQEIMSDERDEDKIQELDKELRDVYQEITDHVLMIRLSDAKDVFAQTYNYISQIISGSANGEDPDSIEPASSCTGSCSTCGGCH